MRVIRSNSLIPQAKRGHLIKILVDGEVIEAYEGETIAAAMLAAGISTFRTTQKRKEPRSIYCGMGMCYECLVIVDRVNHLRACLTPAKEGMMVETGKDNSL